MLVRFKFLDTEQWGVYATLRTLIALCLFAIGGFLFEFPTLILASLIGMIQGGLMERIIFVFFMTLLFYRRSFDYLKKLAFVILAVISTSFLKEGGSLHLWLGQYLMVTRIAIALWFLYIFYRMVYQ